MPPANSPSQTPVYPYGSPPYLGMLAEAQTSVPDLGSTLVQAEDSADHDNVQFLRSTLAQLDGTFNTDTPPQTDSQRQPGNSSVISMHNITQSERETARRLRRYVLQSGRTAPATQPGGEQRTRSTRGNNRSTEYRGWAPGSSDLENNNEPAVTLSDLRALARGHVRTDLDTGFGEHVRQQSARSVTAPHRPPRDGEEMEWEPSRFLYTDGDQTTGDILQRTTALLQSVRRQARFSPPSTSQAEQALSAAGRELALQRQQRADADRTRTTGRATPPASRSSHRYRQETPSEEASRWLEEAIKYLECLRGCHSASERIQSAAAGGFVSGGFFLGNTQTDDFVMDTRHILPPARSSWLRPGGIFSGVQKSTTSISLSLPTLASQSARRSQGRAGDSRRQDQSTSSTTDHPEGLGPPGSWFNRIVSRVISDANIDDNTNPGACHEDSWPVKVTITSVSYDAMTLTGTMEAFNVPNKASPSQQSTIATYLEGEIIDFNRYTLETTSFNARSSVDSRYWRELEPFRSMPDHSLVQNLLSQRWLKEELGGKYILMRWKERCFITPADAQVHLTISGFYYVSLRRSDGHLEGLYYDPTSTPYQHLTLKADSRQFPALQMR